MTIGLLTVDLDIGGAFSLKDKRVVLNRVRDRVRKTFNVAIAEIDDQNLWNHACLGIVAISNEQRHVNQMLSRVIAFIQTVRDCVVEDYTMEFM